MLFKVKAHDSYLITIEALENNSSNPKGIKFENGKDSFISKKMSEAIPGFRKLLLIVRLKFIPLIIKLKHLFALRIKDPSKFKGNLL